MITCLTGLPGSGKSTAAKLFSRGGFKVYEISGIIKAEMRRRRIAINPMGIEAFVNKEKKEHGEDVFALMMGRMLENAKGKILVVGFRSIAEFEAVERLAGARLPLIALYTPERTRFKRVSGRKVFPIKNMAEFMMRERSNLDMGIGALIRRADYVVSNAGSLKDFKESIGELITIMGEAK